MAVVVTRILSGTVPIVAVLLFVAVAIASGAASSVYVPAKVV